MAAKTREASESVAELLAHAPRVQARLADRGVQYLGACVVQAPGAWTRVGPTWRVPGLGWVCVGPGAKNWGTSQGLAELATHPTAKPEWHAIGVAVVPTPNLVFAVVTAALQGPAMRLVAELAAQAEEHEARTRA